jgi:hypothetical protein
VGRIRNLRKPLRGAAGVPAFVAVTSRSLELDVVERELNARPALVFFRAGEPFAALPPAVADGKIQRVYFHADVSRLGHVDPCEPRLQAQATPSRAVVFHPHGREGLRSCKLARRCSRRAARFREHPRRVLQPQSVVAAVGVVVARAARIIRAARRGARGADARAVRQALQKPRAVCGSAGRRGGAVERRRQSLGAARAITARTPTAAARVAHAARALSVFLTRAARLAAGAQGVARPAVEVGLAAVQRSVAAARGLTALRVARHRTTSAAAHSAHALGGGRAGAACRARQRAAASAVYAELVLVAQAVVARGQGALPGRRAAAARAIGARAALDSVRAARALAATTIGLRLVAVGNSVAAGGFGTAAVAANERRALIVVLTASPEARRARVGPLQGDGCWAIASGTLLLFRPARGFALARRAARRGRGDCSNCSAAARRYGRHIPWLEIAGRERTRCDECDDERHQREQTRSLVRRQPAHGHIARGQGESRHDDGSAEPFMTRARPSI